MLNRPLKMGITGVDAVEEQYRFYFKHLLGKCHSLFKLGNVPEKFDTHYFLNSLFLFGQVGVADFNGNLYAVLGNPGGEPNAYYKPTQYVVANPVLGSKQFTINKGREDNAVVVYLTPSDETPAMASGLYPLIQQTATLMADNIVSINCAQMNTRVQAIVTADTPELRKSAEIALQQLYGGKPWQVLDQDLMDKIGVNPIAGATTANSLQQLIETQQYLMAQFYQNLGIKSNAINKKERLITDEVNSQDDFISISFNTMFESIKNGLERVNEMFGTDITIEKNGVLMDTVADDEEAQEQAQTEEEITRPEEEEKEDKTPEETNTEKEDEKE